MERRAIPGARFSLCSSLLVLALALRLSADPTVQVLPNGLTIVVEERHAAPVVVVNFWVRAGSKDEDPKDAGVSHYLEHMFYRGTATRASLQNREEVLAVGGKTSAGTWYDWTNFWNIVPSEHFVLALDGLADAFQHLTLDAKQMDNERSVVGEEIRQRIDDPSTFVYEEMMARAFGEHPYARRVVGTRETVDAFTHETLARYYARYVPGRLVVAIVGDVDTDKAIAEVKERLGEGKPSGPPKDPPVESRFRCGGRETLERAGLAQAYLAAGFRIPGYRHPDRPAIEVAARILYGRLQSTLVEDERIANEVSAHAFVLGDQGLLAVTAKPIHVKDISLVERRCLELVKELRDEGVTQLEVASMVRYFQLQDLFSGETDFQRAQDLGEALLNGDVRYSTEWSKRVGAVTAKDVERVVGLYLCAENYSSVCLVPGGVRKTLPSGEEERIQAALAALACGRDAPKGLDFAKETYPRTPTPSEGTRGGGGAGTPRPVESRLANGMRVLAATRADSQTVEVGVYLPAGSACDAKGESGCASLALRWMQEGGSRFDRNHLLWEMNRVGGQWGLTVERDWMQARLTVAPGDAEAGLAVVSDILARPRLEDREFEKVRAGLLATIREEDDTLNVVAFKRFLERVFAGHPYGRPRSGRAEEVAALTPERVRAWVKAFVRPERALAVVVSGERPRAMASWAEKAFGEWKAEGEAGTRAEATPSPQTGVCDALMQKEQACGVIGALVPGARCDEHAALGVLTDLLRLRVFKDLVYEKALAYTASSWIDWMRDGSYVSVSFSTAPEKFERTLAAARGHLDRVVAEGATKKEVEQVKLRLLGSRVLAEEAGAGLLEVWGRLEMLGLGWQYQARSREATEAVTAEQVAAAARAYLAADKRVTVRVTPSAR